MLNYFFFFQSLEFTNTNIHSLQQINALSVVRSLDHLTIALDGNPVTKFTLWRLYTIFRLAHFSLKKINDVEVGLSSHLNFLIGKQKTALTFKAVLAVLSFCVCFNVLYISMMFSSIFSFVINLFRLLIVALDRERIIMLLKVNAAILINELKDGLVSLSNISVQVSGADVINAERLFGSLSLIVTSQFSQQRLDTPVGDGRKKHLTHGEDKPRKSEGKGDKSHVEQSGRAALVYTAADIRAGRQVKGSC